MFFQQLWACGLAGMWVFSYITKGGTEGRRDGRTDGGTDGRTGRRAGGRVGGMTDGRVDRWMDGRTNGQEWKMDARTQTLTCITHKHGRTNKQTNWQSPISTDWQTKTPVEVVRFSDSEWGACSVLVDGCLRSTQQTHPTCSACMAIDQWTWSDLSINQQRIET